MWLALPSRPLRADEPVYQGRTLTSWLSDFDFGRFQDSAKNEAAERAIQAIGAEAIPVLIDRLSTKSSASKRFLDRVGSLQRQGKFEEASNLVGSSMIEDIHTVAAFRILGSKARPAVPELIELLAPSYEAARVTEAPAVELGDRNSVAAAKALATIGPDATPPLIDALNSGNVRIQFGAAMALEYSGPEPEIIRALIASLHDPDRDVRWRAVRTLGGFGAAPQNTVPAIAERLRTDPAANVRYYALSALREFGPYAQAALPDVIEATSDPEPGLRDKAREALIKILPVEASR